VSPHLAPSAGGTAVRAYVTGLPFEAADEGGGTLVQDMIPVKVRLQCESPFLDVVLDGKVVDVDTVEFFTPGISGTPFGHVVERENTTLAALLSVSVDGGATWTQGGAAASRHAAVDGSSPTAAGDEDAHPPTTLWIAPWPAEGPAHVEPDCSPAAGGTELLLHVELPSKMPVDALSVKFGCRPPEAIEDPELQDRAEDLAKLALYEATAKAWLDPGGRGIRCIAPKLDEANVRLYSYSLEVSLDGVVYLARPLPFAVYALKVIALEPNLGPLQEPTEVRIKCTGAVPSAVKRVRLDFREDLGWPSRVVPAMLDHTTGEIYFSMPELSAEARALADEERARIAAAQAEAPAPEQAGDGSGGASAEEAQEAAVDPEGGLGGMEVVVELSLNGQNFTEDAVRFAYHPQLEPKAIEVLAGPDGAAPEPPKEDPKAKKGGKGAVEEPADIVVLPASKLGCELARGAMASEFAALRVDIFTKVGDEEMRHYSTVDLAGAVEAVPTPPPTPPPEDPKAKNAPPSPPPPEDLPPRDMVVALAPGVRAADIPEGAVLFLRAFQVSVNGRNFVPCPEGALPMRLAIMPPEEE